MKNNIFISYDHILFLRNYEITQPHKHKMKHITIAINGEMKCNLGKDKATTYGYK